MIKLQNVVKTYPNGENDVYALEHINLEIEENEFVVVVGPSGSGKSTLINVASGLDTCDAGIVRYNDFEITKCLKKNVLCSEERMSALFSSLIIFCRN